jgi:hypothetical protein
MDQVLIKYDWKSGSRQAIGKIKMTFLKNDRRNTKVDVDLIQGT